MKRWIVIDIGCHECGVDHELVSAHLTEEGAIRARNARDVATNNWRDSGHTEAVIFEVEL